jgi:2-oxoglutarate ferredoxin oxidoreductase subunit alpha
VLPIDFAKIAATVNDSIKVKKLLTNMVYVGVMAELLHIPDDILKGAVEHQFESKQKVIDMNVLATAAGRTYCRDNIKMDFQYRLEAREFNKGKILIEGNAAAGLGSVFAGCTVAPWYPITPSSSLAENFEMYCKKLRVGKNGEQNFAMIQAEDELGAIAMVAGAGWAGARAMTTTSGPGISLMAEAAGLMYFAEIPGVIWNVQRAGPSTGLPTRTLQGDVMTCAHLSHGDTRHPLLFPATPKECFEMAQTAFDLADRLQTLVFVMSDLDLGMNQWICDEFQYPAHFYDRGKILSKDDLDKVTVFKRYADIDGDGIPYRTLPGTEHDKAGFFTRGTGHDEDAKYTENSDVFAKLLERLDRKWQTAKGLVPKPVIDEKTDQLGLIAFGSTDSAVQELRDQLKSQGHETSYMRLRAYPFTREVENFIAAHKRVVVLEQNYDGQMRKLLIQEYPQFATKLGSAVSYDGWPVRADVFKEGVLNGNR